MGRLVEDVDEGRAVRTCFLIGLLMQEPLHYEVALVFAIINQIIGYH